jgi:hypothetical protein
MTFSTFPKITTGDFEISPTSGIALKTPFVINMSGWKPANENGDLYATLWSVAVYEDHEIKTRISEAAKFDESHTF